MRLSELTVSCLFLPESALFLKGLVIPRSEKALDVARGRGEGLNATFGVLRQGSQHSGKCKMNISLGSCMLQCIFFLQTAFFFRLSCIGRAIYIKWMRVIGSNTCLWCFIDLSIIKVRWELASIHLVLK